MKKIGTIWIFLSLFAAVLAQGLNQIHPNNSSLGGSSQFTGSLNSYDPLGDFYGQTAMMNVHASPAFYGTSIAYLTSGDSRFMYGLDINILQVDNGVNQFNGSYYRLPGQSTLLIPAWFTFKYRLGSHVNDTILPYIIGGAGPAFGLQLGSSRDFLTSVGQAQGFWGGGAFLGTGVDYLWDDSWAISADVRYHLMEYDAPVATADSYRGLSLYLGVIRAFDW